MESSGALGEAVGFLAHFEGLPDARQAGKVVYPLDEVLLLSLLAVLAGAEAFTDIESVRFIVYGHWSHALVTR